jgi:hypothetical protein
MKVKVKDTKSGQPVGAGIKAAGLSDLPLKKDGWSFNWRQLHKEQVDGLFFKLSLTATPEKVEGIVKLSLTGFGLFSLDCIEISPENYGSKGRYDWVAGCLLAFSYQMSKYHGKDAYKGFLSFDSKTVLIELYIRKYGAKYAGGQKLFFDTEDGEKLISTYLPDIQNE